jgi:hypothetical protein
MNRDVIIIVGLVAACALGRFMRRWYRAAASGFGTGLVTNMPLLMRMDARAIVWATGRLLAWAPLLLLAIQYKRWLLAVLTYLVSRTLEVPLLKLLFRGDVETGIALRKECGPEYDKVIRMERGRDPMDAVLRW